VGASAPAAPTVAGFWGVDDNLAVALPGVPDDVLVVRNVFNSRGQLETVSRRVRVDPGVTIAENTRTYFDSLGRVIAVGQNCAYADPISLEWDSTAVPPRWKVYWGGAPSLDQSRTTTKVYDALGHVTQQVAHRTGTEGVQATSYRYTWQDSTPAESEVPSNS